MVNFIPGDHHRPDCGLYERSREPIPTSRMRVWAKDGMVRWDPWNNILWGWPSTSQRAAPSPPLTDTDHESEASGSNSTEDEQP